METLIHSFSPALPYVLQPFAPHLIFRTIIFPHCSILVSSQEIPLQAGSWPATSVLERETLALLQ